MRMVDEIRTDDDLAEADEDAPGDRGHLAGSAVAAPTRRRSRRAAPGEQSCDEERRRCSGEGRHTRPICNAHTRHEPGTGCRVAAG